MLSILETQIQGKEERFLCRSLLGALQNEKPREGEEQNWELIKAHEKLLFISMKSSGKGLKQNSSWWGKNKVRWNPLRVLYTNFDNLCFGTQLSLLCSHLELSLWSWRASLFTWPEFVKKQNVKPLNLQNVKAQMYSVSQESAFCFLFFFSCFSTYSVTSKAYITYHRKATNFQQYMMPLTSPEPPLLRLTQLQGVGTFQNIKPWEMLKEECVLRKETN